jgi:hypothetical protein
MIEIIKLIFVFLLMVAALKITKLLYAAIGCAAVATALLFNLGPVNSLVIAGKAVISPISITTVLAFYFITFLQRMLEKRGKLNRAQEALNGIFNNRRINASLAPVLIGMLPSPAVVTIAGAMVDSRVWFNTPRLASAQVMQRLQNLVLNQGTRSPVRDRTSLREIRHRLGCRGACSAEAHLGYYTSGKSGHGCFPL